MSAPVGDSAIGKVHFLTSYVWRAWDHSLHFFELLMCAAPIYWDLRQFGFCRLLCRGSGSPADLQHDRLRSEGGKGHDTFYLPLLSKGLLAQGPWCAFQFTKVTTASPRTTQVYHSWMAS